MNGSVLFEGNPILSGSLNVNTGGNIEPLEVEINENGTREITPPSGVDGYAPITIDTIVPQIVPILESLNVTQNGRYEPPEGVAGFNEVNVEVLHPLSTLNVTENGSYEPPTGVYGFSNVVVDVAAFNYYAKNLILVNHSGQYQGWITMPNALTVGKKYLAIAYRENDAIPVSCGVFTMAIGSNIEYSRDKFIRFNSTTEIASPVAYSAGYSISIADVPEDWLTNPFV